MCVCNSPVSLIVLLIFLCGGELVWASSVAQQAEITQVRKAVLQLSHQWLQLHKLGKEQKTGCLVRGGQYFTTLLCL